MIARIALVLQRAADVLQKRCCVLYHPAQFARRNRGGACARPGHRAPGRRRQLRNNSAAAFLNEWRYRDGTLSASLSLCSYAR